MFVVAPVGCGPAAPHAAAAAAAADAAASDSLSKLRLLRIERRSRGLEGLDAGALGFLVVGVAAAATLVVSRRLQQPATRTLLRPLVRRPEPPELSPSSRSLSLSRIGSCFLWCFNAASAIVRQYPSRDKPRKLPRIRSRRCSGRRCFAPLLCSLLDRLIAVRGV